MKKRINKIVLSFMVLLAVGFSVWLIGHVTPEEESLERKRLCDTRIVTGMQLSERDILNIDVAVQSGQTKYGSYSADLWLESGGAVNVFSSGEPFSEMLLMEGRVPEKSGECLLAVDEFVGPAYEIGEVITLTEDAGELLAEAKYTVVGFASSHYVEGVCSGAAAGECCIFIPEGDFLCEEYTDVWISTYSMAAYSTLTYSVDMIRAFEAGETIVRLDEMLDEAEMLLTRAREKYPEREREIAELESDLRKRRKRLNDDAYRALNRNGIRRSRWELQEKLQTVEAAGDIDAFDSFDEMAEWIRSIKVSPWGYVIWIPDQSSYFKSTTNASIMFLVILSGTVLLICLMFLGKSQKYVSIVFSGALALCTALVMMSVGQPYAADAAGERQYDLYGYDAAVSIEPEQVDQIVETLEGIENIYSMRFVSEKTEPVSERFEQWELSSKIYWVGEGAEYLDSILLDASTGKLIELTHNSVIVSQKLAERNGLKVGSKLRVREKEFVITDIAECYDGICMWINASFYESMYGEKWEPDIIWISFYEYDPADLLDIPGVRSVSDPRNAADRFAASLEPCFDFARILLAAALVLTLFLSFATARKNFHPFAIFFGAVLGLIIGIPLKDAFLTTIETVDVFFVRDTPVWLVFLALLPAVVCAIARWIQNRCDVHDK